MDDDARSATPIRDHQKVSTSVGDWIVLLPYLPEGTPLLDAQLPFDAIRLRFDWYHREARVRVSILGPGVKKTLPEREHGLLLLTLARARQQDANQPADQRGWRDRESLGRLLGLYGNSLNVAVHRARQWLSDAGVQSAARLVEVRSRLRRLGTDRFEIELRCSDVD